jgi:hypothetical protein
MPNTTVPTGPASPAPKSLLARFVGIIVAPRATFEAVVAHPKWFGMLALTVGVTAALVGGFLLTKAGQDAWIDAALNGRPGMTDQQVQGLERVAPFVGYGAIGFSLIGWPIFLAIIAGILFGVFNAALGGNASFEQIFTVVVHAGPIGTLSQLVTMPLNYVRGTMTSATNLGVLTQSFLPEGSFLARLLGTFDIFIMWQLMVLAIGLGALYRRRTQPIATTFFAIYVVIALIVAFIRRGAAA